MRPLVDFDVPPPAIDDIKECLEALLEHPVAAGASVFIDQHPNRVRKLANQILGAGCYVSRSENGGVRIWRKKHRWADGG